jgi:hypothetical protein
MLPFLIPIKTYASIIRFKSYKVLLLVVKRIANGYDTGIRNRMCHDWIVHAEDIQIPNVMIGRHMQKIPNVMIGRHMWKIPNVMIAWQCNYCWIKMCREIFKKKWYYWYLKLPYCKICFDQQQKKNHGLFDKAPPTSLKKIMIT